MKKDNGITVKNIMIRILRTDVLIVNKIKQSWTPIYIKYIEESAYAVVVDRSQKILLSNCRQIIILSRQIYFNCSLSRYIY